MKSLFSYLNIYIGFLPSIIENIEKAPIMKYLKFLILSNAKFTNTTTNDIRSHIIFTNRY